MSFLVASVDDYSLLNTSVLLTFSPGFSDGMQACTPITTNADLLVECEEDFSVTMTLVTQCPSIQLGNDMISVTLLDSNGTYVGVPGSALALPM